jgi:hypothetical protein
MIKVTTASLLAAVMPGVTKQSLTSMPDYHYTKRG